MSSGHSSRESTRSSSRTTPKNPELYSKHRSGGVSGGKSTILGYEFVPLPRAAWKAYVNADLNRHELDVLLFVADRMDRATKTVTVSLEHIVRGIGWTNTPDYLSKILRGLRDKGWLSYSTDPGKKGARYVIRLSGDGPSTNLRIDPSTEHAEIKAGSGIPEDPSSDTWSEDDPAGSVEPDQSNLRIVRAQTSRISAQTQAFKASTGTARSEDFRGTRANLSMRDAR